MSQYTYFYIRMNTRLKTPPFFHKILHGVTFCFRTWENLRRRLSLDAAVFSFQAFEKAFEKERKRRSDVSAKRQGITSEANSKTIE